MDKAVVFIVAGYLSGSILFARLSEQLSNKGTFIQDSKDKNPGTANAFQYGGFWCGVFTLVGDLLKGFLPLRLYIRSGGDFFTYPLLASAVLAAPVLGHAFPLFFRFQGGKGIAVTFGCLLGIFPMTEPFSLLALLFLIFTFVLRITPHFQRTIVTYTAACLGMIGLRYEQGVIGGFMIMTMIVCVRLHMSREKREKIGVKLLWRH